MATGRAVAHDWGRFRTIDGSRNHRDNPSQGAAGRPLMRLVSADYGDGVSAPAGSYRPTPRIVSNSVCRQREVVNDPRGLSRFAWLWAQFIEHELTFSGEASPEERCDMRVSERDAEYSGWKIPFLRSDYAPTAEGAKRREQLNQVSSYLDGSSIYGSDFTRAHALRKHCGGQLKTSPGPDGPLLPRNDAGLPNSGGFDARLFLAGDLRVNESVVLTALHTLFVREHNRICAEIRQARPTLDDEEIYQRARKRVGALIQAITYNEYLPALLGVDALRAYRGYDHRANPSISNLCATAALRLTHTAAPAEIHLGSGFGTMALRDGFFRPDAVSAMGVEPFLQSLADQPMQRIDPSMVEDLRTYLFRRADSAARELLDLAALNIQRGRDHGLPGYQSCRRELGLAPKASFQDVTSDFSLQRALEDTYGKVEDMDVWVGMLAEDHHPESSVGELARTVLVDQFQRIRDGDWYWYENDPEITEPERRDLRGTTLSEVVARNTGLASLPKNVFVVPDEQAVDAE